MNHVARRVDLYQRITEYIIEAIEKGARTFEMPWHSKVLPVELPVNAMTGEPYRGTNIVVLWSEAYRKGFTSSYWATYRQWNEIGCQVRRGEKSTTLLYYKHQPLYAEDVETGEEVFDYRLITRALYVFNSGQVDGWTKRHYIPPNMFEAFAEADRFVAMTGADIRHGGADACYIKGTDYIQMPDKDRFTGTTAISAREAYYAALFHELIHMTGSWTRCARNLGARFGEMDDAMEELVAELGAAILCGEFGFSNVPRSHHTGHVPSWLKVLKTDKKAAIAISMKASEAVAFLRPG